ncbi:copper chaperone PCu(A)C [Methylophilus sp. 5]|uniref:copper chaperone PCu(A)C n=1 Tax=Methylophilus sp. 5 TaxID=1112274 RepID=UPI00048E7521|nr:copper chaperone PCu(A)C [Methylophilus sp. 5]
MHAPHFLLRMIVSICLLGVAVLAQADVKMTDAWVRASNPGQSVAAAYITLSSPQDVTLVYAETERAGTVEMHSMTMQNGVMKMRSMEELPVPAGKPVKLAPGGLHLMLFEFPTPFKAGEQVKFRLCFKDKQGKITDQFVTMPVKAAP